MSLDNSFLKARVIGIFGAFYVIRDLHTGQELLAQLRGKLRLSKESKKIESYNVSTKNFLTIGDKIFYSLLKQKNKEENNISSVKPNSKQIKKNGNKIEKQHAEAVIEKLEKRSNVFGRTDTKHRQLLAANIDCVILVLSWDKPHFNHGFADRVITEAFINKLPIVLIINKSDLSIHLDKQEKNEIDEKLKVYRSIFIEVFSEHLTQSLSMSLQNFLETTTWKTFLLIGQSGCGKSTFLNKVCQKQLAVTAKIGVAGKGRHTTTNPMLYQWKENGQQKEIIDTPGIREFGLMHHQPQEIIEGFPEMKNVSCRFEDCRHLEEPDCKVKEKVKEGSIAFFRYNSYKNIVSDLQQNFKPRRGDYRLQ